MRFAVVDIETTGFHAEECIILNARVKAPGAPAKVFGLHAQGFGRDEATLDEKVVLALRREMEAFDGWITWYGLMFDLPFIDDRLMLTGHSPLERRFARGLDMMYQTSWGKGTFKKRTLEHVAYSLGYGKKAFRFPLSETICENAKKEALDHFRRGRTFYDMILHHNEGCMAMTEFCYERLKPRVVTISKR
jgi:uncharacterized protein YprB with RNaseH-like and TPR domain